MYLIKFEKTHFIKVKSTRHLQALLTDKTKMNGKGEAKISTNSITTYAGMPSGTTVFLTFIVARGVTVSFISIFEIARVL
jgi:hypothetical protein